MKMGDKEWFENLNKYYTFPSKIAFILMRDRDGSVSIFSTLIRSSAKISNIKFSQISRGTWTSVGSAVLSVKEYQNGKEYLQELKKLNEIWGFALRKSDDVSES